MLAHVCPISGGSHTAPGTDLMVCEVQNVYSLALYKKRLPNLTVESLIWNNSGQKEHLHFQYKCF